MVDTMPKRVLSPMFVSMRQQYVRKMVIRVVIAESSRTDITAIMFGWLDVKRDGKSTPGVTSS